MNGIQECKTLKMSWAEASRLIGKRLDEILGHPIDCATSPDAYDYWSIGFLGYRMPLSELHFLLETMHLDDSEALDSLPDCSERVDSVDCFGMALSQALLKSALGVQWEKESWNDEYLWLTTAPVPTQRDFRIGNVTLSPESLKSKDELMHWLVEHGANHLQLMDFCSDYMSQYCNELCWQYPISDGKHLGTYIVLVKEGVLSLPYDDADKSDGEIFCLDDVCMFDAKDMEVFITDWQLFSQDLQTAMEALWVMLKEKEVSDHGKD